MSDDQNPDHKSTQAMPAIPDDRMERNIDNLYSKVNELGRHTAILGEVAQTWKDANVPQRLTKVETQVAWHEWALRGAIAAVLMTALGVVVWRLKNGG